MTPENLLFQMPAAPLRLWMIIRYFDWENEDQPRQGCRKSVDELANLTGKCRRAVEVELKRLRQSGAIRIEREHRFSPLAIYCTPENYDPTKMAKFNEAMSPQETAYAGNFSTQETSQRSEENFATTRSFLRNEAQKTAHNIDPNLDQVDPNTDTTRAQAQRGTVAGQQVALDLGAPTAQETAREPAQEEPQAAARHGKTKSKTEAPEIAELPKRLRPHAATAQGLLAELVHARMRVRPRCRLLHPTPSNLYGIAERLAEGNTPEDIRHVIAVREAEVRVNPAAMEWFNAVTPFRPDNFARSLAKTIEDASRKPEPPNRPYDPRTEDRSQDPRRVLLIPRRSHGPESAE